MKTRVSSGKLLGFCWLVFGYHMDQNKKAILGCWSCEVFLGGGFFYTFTCANSLGWYSERLWMAYQVTRSKVQLSPRRNSTNSSLVAGLPSLVPFFFSLGHGKTAGGLLLVLGKRNVLKAKWRYWSRLVVEAFGLQVFVFDSLQAACCWCFSMSCKLGEAKGSGQERLLIFFHLGTSITKCKPHDVAGGRCYRSCSTAQRSRRMRDWVPRMEKGFWIRKLPRLGWIGASENFATSPKSSIKMLDYLWSRNHHFLFLPPNFETHLLSVDQSTQLRLFLAKWLFYPVGNCVLCMLMLCIFPVIWCDMHIAF